jgi:hypothetical protein
VILASAGGICPIGLSSKVWLSLCTDRH